MHCIEPSRHHFNNLIAVSDRGACCTVAGLLHKVCMHSQLLHWSKLESIRRGAPQLRDKIPGLQNNSQAVWNIHNLVGYNLLKSVVMLPPAQGFFSLFYTAVDTCNFGSR